MAASKSMSEMLRDILADGVIDAGEVKQLRERLYADGSIDREEAELLFKLNDATSGKSNDASWQSFFVEALTDHVLGDKSSPGALDDDEAKWLLACMESDGKLDANEKALIDNIKAKAKSLPTAFRAKFG